MENFEQIALVKEETLLSGGKDMWMTHTRYWGRTRHRCSRVIWTRWTRTSNGRQKERLWKDIEGLQNRTERGLAFLDTLLVINEDVMTKTWVYRKGTHTDQYLNFQSNHPLEHKGGVVKALAHRAKTVVSKREERTWSSKRSIEMQWLPRMDFEGLKRRKKQWCRQRGGNIGEAMETSMIEKSKKIPVMIPYVKGFLEQMRRVFGKYGIPSILN